VILHVLRRQRGFCEALQRFQLGVGQLLQVDDDVGDWRFAIAGMSDAFAIAGRVRAINHFRTSTQTRRSAGSSWPSSAIATSWVRPCLDLLVSRSRVCAGEIIAVVGYPSASVVCRRGRPGRPRLLSPRFRLTILQRIPLGTGQQSEISGVGDVLMLAGDRHSSRPSTPRSAAARRQWQITRRP
jgi:hypothetical protein